MFTYMSYHHMRAAARAAACEARLWEMSQPTAAAAPDGRMEIIAEAAKLTSGNRNEVYGDPVLNHQHIADIFNAITGRDLSAREIVLVHQATKLARRAKNPTHRDSYVDGVAYTGIEWECAAAEASLPPRQT